MTIKGRLLSIGPMLKPFSGEKKFCPVEMGPKNAGFWGKLGQKPYILVSRPQKALPCAEPRRLTYFCVKIGARVSAVTFLKNQKNSRTTFCRGARNHACAEPKPLNRFG